MDLRANAMINTALQLVVARICMIAVFMAFYLVIKLQNDGRKRKRGSRYSLLGRIPKQIEHFHDLVNINDRDCIDILQMDRNTFHRLCQLLEQRGGLTNSRYVNVQEQTALFLQTLAHHHKNRVVRYDFKRSGQTVSHYYNKTLDAVLKVGNLILVKPKPIDAACTDDCWKCFKGCLGALDGTYVKLRVPVADQVRYRSRKGDICTNVLGACDSNLNFIYIFAGFEGSAGDGRVLREALNKPTGLKIEAGTYYLCDQGYQNGEGFLTPFRSRRYHLDEWGAMRNRVEQKIKKMIPGSNVRGEPRVLSKITVWKRHYYLLRGVLGSSGKEGLDPVDHTITIVGTEKWETGVKLNPDLEKIRHKIFPYYYDWCEMFGVDRANGEGAHDVGSSVQQILSNKMLANQANVARNQPTALTNEEDDDALSGARTPADPMTFQPYAPKKRKAKAVIDEESFTKMMGTYMADTKEDLIDLSKAIRSLKEVDPAVSTVYTELEKLPEFSTDQRVVAVNRICTNPTRLTLFNSMGYEARVSFVRNALNGNV